MGFLKRLLGKELPGARASVQGHELFGAAEDGDLPRVKALIEAKADVNAKMNYGATALLVASQEGHLEVVRTLLGAGANPNAKAETGDTALLQASQMLHASQ